MGFAEDVKALAERFSTMGNNILTEEATKMSLILPFFNSWGTMFLIPPNFAQNLQLMSESKKVRKLIMQYW